MCIYISLECDPAHTRRARYAFEVLFDTLGFPYSFLDSDEHGDRTQSILIAYGKAGDLKNRSKKRPGSILICDDWVEDIDQIKVGILSTPRGKKLPVLGRGADEVTQKIPTSADSPVVVEKDLIFSSFFLLSRWEEVESKAADKHGRFPTRESISHQHGFSRRAVVNQYLQFLLQIISEVARARKVPLLRKCFWPDGKKLAVCLTHDVDIIQKWYLYSLVRSFELVKTGQLSSLGKTLWGIFKGLVSRENPALSFEQLTSVEEGFSFKSSFYFMMGRPGLQALLSSDITYDLARPEILRKAKELLGKGFEVGLHASYNTFLDSRALQEEKEELEHLIESPVSGLRQHFLRARFSESWIDQKECGFSYDTSLGFADEAGYRASFAFPFYVYDLQNDRELDFMELPLAVMDRTYSKYLSFSPGEIKKDIIRMFTELEDFGGLATILWHTHMVDALGFPGYPRLYEEILDFVHQRGYFVAPGKEIADWWRKRKNLEFRSHAGQDGRFVWECHPSDSLERLSLEVVGVRAGEVSVNGCNCTIVRDGQSAILKLGQIEKGAKITLATEIE
jgi:hypothetical protein